MKSSFMGQSVLTRLHHFWHFFLHMKPGKHTSGAGRVNTWIFKSVPNLIVIISLNPVNSGVSNGVIHVSIPALGDKNWNLLCFLFTCSSLGIPSEYWAILYTVG